MKATQRRKSNELYSYWKRTKTLEKMIENYIRTEILDRMPLHPGQHAYSAGRLTETALFVLTKNVQSSNS